MSRDLLPEGAGRAHAIDAIDRALAGILATEPERDEAMNVCIRAWHDLGTCRPIGMSMGLIPWTAIVEWCEVHGLDRDRFLVLVDVIRLLDNERAEREAAKQRLKKPGA